MTTRLAYQYLTAIDYGALEYDPDEPEPLPDGMYQTPILIELLHILAARYAGGGRSPDDFLGSNTILCYDPSNLNRRVSPDCYMAFGVDVDAIKRRKLYLPWEVGKPPDFAMEVASESTAREDLGRKREIYEGMGVLEYWRLDVTGGEYYGEPLVGERLVAGRYERLPLTTEPDGILKGYSPLLDIYFTCRGEWYSLYDPASGEYLMNLTDTENLLRAEQDARVAEHRARMAEQQARQRAEERVRQLEEELRRRDEQS